MFLRGIVALHHCIERFDFANDKEINSRRLNKRNLVAKSIYTLMCLWLHYTDWKSQTGTEHFYLPYI